MSEIPVPSMIYCPKCGAPLKLERIQNPEILAKMEERDYAAGARGICPCGVTAVLAVKTMPKSPTFTLFWNIYKF